MNYSIKIKDKFILFSYIIPFLFISSPATAQIVPDSTLPTNSKINTQGNLSIIEEGTKAGNNLFHSFQEFSIPTGHEAFFNNPAVIKNIFSRVTGENISNIDGLIRANGSANLFFLNPNGIIFGENASLDIGGSFIATTADRIDFADGKSFTVRGNNPNVTITISSPIGLGFGSNPGSIVVRGTGNNLSIPIPEFNVVRDNKPTGIELKSGQTFGLLGGIISLEGGNITASEGRIELGSVGAGETVRLSSNSEGWKFNYQNVNEFQDINLLQAASVDTSGNSGGAIQVRGRQININDGSAIISNTIDGNGKGITIESDTLRMSGVTSDNFVSVIASDNMNGTGGDLNIKTNQLYMADGSQIRAIVFGNGTTGELNITANDIEVTGVNPLNEDYLTSIETSVATESIDGTGKDVNINTQNLLVSGGGRILTDTFGLGEAGNLIINAANIELVEFKNRDIPLLTGLSTATRRESTGGNAGNIIINTNILRLIDGGRIRADTRSLGDGGNIIINAQNIEMVGTNPIDTDTSSKISTLTNSTGKAGNIIINVDSLRINNGGEIRADTRSSGNGGNIIIDSQNIELIGFNEMNPNRSSEILTSTTSAGNAGNITINTDNIKVANGGLINANSQRIGKAGNINITAQNIELTGSNPFNRDFLKKGGITIGVSSAIVNEGEINIETETLKITGGSQIRTTTFGNGNAGNINIIGKNIEIIGVNPLDTGRLSSILSKTDGSGNGGDINIKTNSLQIADGAEINANTNRNDGNAGDIDITANSIELRSSNPFRPDLPSLISVGTNNGSGIGGNINIKTNSLQITDGAQIRASTIGSEAGNAGIIDITAKDIQINGVNPFVPDDSDLIDSAIFSNVVAFSISPSDAGKININTENLKLAEGGRIEAIAFSSGNAGEINLDVKNLSIDSDAIITTSSFGSGNAGMINIDAETFKINSASIDATSEQTGGGQININAESLVLNNQAEISTDIFESVDTGGNITLNGDRIQLNNSTISAIGGEQGSGGNLGITTDNFLAFDNSQVIATAEEGNGGNIKINTTGYFVSDDSVVSASSEFGLDGRIEINTPDNDFQKDLELSQLEVVSLPNFFVPRCQNPDRAKLNIGTGEYLPADPGDSFSYPTSSSTGLPPELQEKIERFQRELESNSENEPKSRVFWKPGEPVVNATKIVVSEDNRVFLVAPEEKPKSDLVCKI